MRDETTFAKLPIMVVMTRDSWRWGKTDLKNSDTQTICCKKYRKNPKISDTQKVCCNHPKIWTRWLYHRVMHPKDAARIANSVDSRSSLIWVCTVCPDLSVWKLRINMVKPIWAPSSEFVSSSIPSWQILTAHAQPFRETRDLAFCLKVPLDSLLIWASSEGSGETAQMRRLAWTFTARIGDKYQIRLTRSI